MNSQAPSETEALVFAILTVLAIILAVFWVLFPVLVYDQLKKLNKTATAQLAVLTRLTTLSERVAPAPASDPHAEAQTRCAYCDTLVTYAAANSGRDAQCPNPKCGQNINLP